MERKIIKKSSIYSREEFSCILEREFARAGRSNKVFSVVDFDIEDVETDRELGKQLLQTLAKGMRITDAVGWLKGHHIGVLLYNTPFEGAQVFFKRIFNLLTTPPIFLFFTIHTCPTEGHIKDGSNYQDPEGLKAFLRSLFVFN
jgi:hypothetical protein